MCEHGKTKCDSVGFCSTGILLGCVSIWCSCRFSTFSALSVGLDWPAVTSSHCRMSAVNVAVGSGCVGVGPRVGLPTMMTNSALVERSEEDVFDASSEDELPGEQNQWCSLQELWFHDTVGRVLVKALGVDSAMCVSERCMFAIFVAPADREPQNGCVVSKKKTRHEKQQSRRHFVRASVLQL